MKREYWYVLIVYLAMQLSGVVGVPLLLLLGENVLNWVPDSAIAYASGYWGLISFLLALLIILRILRHDQQLVRAEQPAIQGFSVIVWSVFGVILAFMSQYVAILIETAIGIPSGSANTQNILTVIELVPLFLLVSSIFGPILEEIVFRKVIFGEIYKRTNFLIAGIMSALIFATAHNDFPHLILYTSMGFAFAYLYVKTNRILVPILAHVAMNSLVVLVQQVYQPT